MSHTDHDSLACSPRHGPMGTINTAGEGKQPHKTQTEQLPERSQCGSNGSRDGRVSRQNPVLGFATGAGKSTAETNTSHQVVKQRSGEELTPRKGELYV